ncbi:MAG: DNA repair protein RecO [Candidatus Andersenbacteria bacterium CG10_big_fil_rev_8_21_14_0_10_54_11]|uniref:DNA repair protein RecO n=1 Tax=Candidatus Andersenbacteria bacterium CG10_big_fil_rev_8_21_14_0_10_54_11 TaxID=1974485 RepID=A0A2M6WZZ2_9BACT|nr:MAG: DNA repair protein RecO [Candidatus Andersenbacteria bacterium CG10_big_fil_rev_8_21_14_0_10_54_11]
MPLFHQSVRALVLSRRNLGEADRLLTLFTYEAGLWRAAAHGVRSLSSRRGSHLEPFTEIAVVLSGHGRLSRITAAETHDYFSALHSDDDALRRAYVVACGLLALFGEHDPQPALYLLLQQLWHHLPRLPQPRRPVAEVAAVLALLAGAGTAPHISRCRVCGYTGTDRSVRLEPVHGSIVCSACSPAGPSVWRLSSVALKAARIAAARNDLVLRTAVSETDAMAVTMPWRTYLRWQGAQIAGEQ